MHTMQPQPQLAQSHAVSGAFTAAQIAIALNIAKRTAHKMLSDCPATGCIIVRGNDTPVWTLDALPERIRAKLAEKASEDRQDIATFIISRAKPWQPKYPLTEIADSAIALATRLRNALLPALARLDSPTLTAADRTRLGLQDYQRAFSHAITERHWQRLLERTLNRDGGNEDFNRLELYLQENPARKVASSRTPADFKPLAEFIQAFADPQNPTGHEKAALWSEVFELFEAGAATKRERKRLRNDLATWLQSHAPWLSRSGSALRVSFDRKLARWVASGRSAASLLDGREEKRGLSRGNPIPQDDLDKIVWHASANCGGRVAQAVNDFRSQGERSGLSVETLSLITRPHASKSYVNRRLMDQVRPEVRMIAPYRLGKKAIDDSTAHVTRDYTKLASMQAVTADDLTPPIYYYVPDGNGWVTLTRGQVLAFVDVRSWKILGWSLLPEKNYSSLSIRTLMNRVCAKWGLPSAWIFEGGLWRNSRVVKGNTPTGWETGLSWADCSVGWEKLGVNFRHAIRARTKPVEGVFRLLQNQMEGLRGYCGRNERVDCPEVTKRAMQDVQFKRVNHPGELFFSFEEWDAELGRLIEDYNATAQEGTTLHGMSPDEAFEAFWPHDNPPTKLDASCWHLVAHYVKPVQVTANGISFRIGKKSFVYRNERTGADRGKELLAWFDPETPEFICVTDKNRRLPYLVERATDVDFLAAPGDLVLQRELAKAAAHSVYPKTRYHVLKAKFAPVFRRNLVDAQTAETAQAMLQQRTQFKQETSQADTTRKKYRRAGLPLRPANRMRPETAAAYDRLAQALQEPDETNSEAKP